MSVVPTNVPTISDLRGIERRCHYVRFVLPPLTKSFFDLGAKITYDLRLFSKSNVQLYCGINNLFNAFQSDYDFGPDRDSGYIYGPTIPRSGYFGMKFTF